MQAGRNRLWQLVGPAVRSRTEERSRATDSRLADEAALRGSVRVHSTVTTAAEPMNVCHAAYFRCARCRQIRGLRGGFTGGRISFIPASVGVRPPFRTLQLRQAQTTFSQVSGPPRLRGMM